MSDLQSLDTGEIYHPAAYAAAVKRRIVGNARLTWRRTHADAEDILDFLLFGRVDEATGKVLWRPHAVYAGEGSRSHIVEGDTFLSKMAYSLDTYGKLSEKQTDAVRRCIAQAAERKAEWARKDAALNSARQHLGAVGAKVELKLTIKKIIRFHGMSFGYGDSGLTYIYIMEDSDRNVVVYKGNSTQLPRGDAEGVFVHLSATVKEHGERDGVKQTIIQRPKRLNPPTAKE